MKELANELLRMVVRQTQAMKMVGVIDPICHCDGAGVPLKHATGYVVKVECAACAGIKLGGKIYG